MERAASSITQEGVALTLVPPLVDEVHQGLQDYLGESKELLGYDAELWKEYVGAASRKVQVGGMLIVSLTVAIGESRDVSTDVHEINDKNRPFSEDLIKKLGAIAEANFKEGKGWRVDR